MMRAGPWEYELLAGDSEVELAPRPMSSIAARSFLVTMIIRKANTSGPTPGHFLVYTLEEEILRQPRDPGWRRWARLEPVLTVEDTVKMVQRVGARRSWATTGATT